MKLWFDCYERGLGGSPDEAQQAIFDVGNAVGKLATTRHPGGVLIEADHMHPDQALEETAAAMAERTTPAYFEAAFEHEDVRARVDILERTPQGSFDVVEVKSGLRVKDYNVDDLSVQAWVLRGAGLRLRHTGVLTLNGDYVYEGGPYALDSLFTFHDLTEVARRKREEVEGNVAAMHTMLRKSAAPKVRPGPHCSEPFDCPYFDHCTKDDVVHAHPVTELPKLGKRYAALVELGVERVEDIPEDFELTPMQARVREAVASRKPWVSPDLARVLAEPEHPIHHLDFETVGVALPRYVGTRPYQALPFQWSNHVETKDGSITHHEYLCREDKDPRREFAETLIDALGKDGSVVIYTTYEVTVLKELAEHLPKSLGKELLAIARRTWDLCDAIRKNYYHPKFHGSFSLKKVLPALVPKLSYDDLDIQDGGAAQRAYVEALTTEEPKRRRQLHEQLLVYCRQDTLAMVELRRTLGRCQASARA